MGAKEEVQGEAGQQGQQLLKPSGTRTEGARGRWSPGGQGRPSGLPAVEEGPGGGQQEFAGRHWAEAEAEAACRRHLHRRGAVGVRLLPGGTDRRAPTRGGKGWTPGAPAGGPRGEGRTCFSPKKVGPPPTSWLQPEEGSRIHVGLMTATVLVKDKAGTGRLWAGKATCWEQRPRPRGACRFRLSYGGPSSQVGMARRPPGPSHLHSPGSVCHELFGQNRIKEYGRHLGPPAPGRARASQTQPKTPPLSPANAQRGGEQRRLSTGLRRPHFNLENILEPGCPPGSPKR